MVVSMSLVVGVPDSGETRVRQSGYGLVRAGRFAGYQTCQCRKLTLVRQVDVAVVVLMPTLIADITYRQNSLGGKGVLNADAVLVARRQLVIVHCQADDAGCVDRPCSGCPSGEREAWVRHLDVIEADLQTERNVGTGVVHVIALNALVHDAEPTADNCLTAATQVIGKTKTWTEGCPVIVDQALRNPILSGDADSIQVKWNACKNRIRAGAQARAGTARAASRGSVRWSANAVVIAESGCFRGVVEAGIKIAHAVVGFVCVRHAIPAQAKVEGETIVYAPVVLNVRGPRNVVPVAMVLNCQLLIRDRRPEQETGEAVSTGSVGRAGGASGSEVLVKGKPALGLTE